MSGGDLQHADEMVVRHLSDEVDSGPVELVLHLALEDLVPAAAVRGLRPVARVRAADDHHMQPRVEGQDLRQAADHDVRAAHRLDVARHVGDDRDRAVEARPLGANPDRGVRIRPQRVGVDAVMDDRDALAHALRKQVPLEAGRRHGGIGDIEGAELEGVLDPRLPEPLLVADREFRIEAEILPDRREVVVFEIRDVPRLRPDILQEQVLAPAGIDDDEVRLESLLRQRSGEMGDREAVLQPVGRVVVAAVEGVPLRAGHRLVREVAHARDPAGLHGAEADHLVTLGGEQACEPHELAWKVLMNEDDLHGSDPQPWL
jgi:hypothetical protein